MSTSLLTAGPSTYENGKSERIGTSPFTHCRLQNHLYVCGPTFGSKILNLFERRISLQDDERQPSKKQKLM